MERESNENSINPLLIIISRINIQRSKNLAGLLQVYVPQKAWYLKTYVDTNNSIDLKSYIK